MDLIRMPPPNLKGKRPRLIEASITLDEDQLAIPAWDRDAPPDTHHLPYTRRQPTDLDDPLADAPHNTRSEAIWLELLFSSRANEIAGPEDMPKKRSRQASALPQQSTSCYEYTGH